MVPLLNILLEVKNGTNCWYINGKIHREDGPAIEWSDGNKEWYINGVGADKITFK